MPICRVFFYMLHSLLFGLTLACGDPVATPRACNNPSDCTDGMQCVDGLCVASAAVDAGGVTLDALNVDNAGHDAGPLADVRRSDRQTNQDVVWPDRVGVDAEAFRTWTSGEVTAGAGLVSGSRYQLRGKLHKGLHQNVLSGQRYQLRLHAQRLGN